MKWIRFCSAVVAMLGLTTAAQAGLLGHFGSGKSCGCAETCQPECCKPVITRPCDVTVHTYQRQCSTIKPPCCDTACAPGACCAPKKSLHDRLFGGFSHKGGHGACCAPAPTCCQPAAMTCAKPAPAACCAPQPAACAKPAPAACAPQPAAACAPQAAACCAPQAAACCAPQACGCAPACGCQKKGLFGGARSWFSGHKLFGHGNDCCDTGCADSCCDTRCCDADPCEVAMLIYQSQTACYAKDRKKAIKKLGKFDCACNPEIMCAFIYGLNDADEEVREEAAEQIGKQTDRNPCCCSKDVVSALTCALADCDKSVRKDAERALRNCGYEVVDGCCDSCCDTCAPGGVAPTPAGPGSDAAPAPAPPADPKAYFPRRMQNNAAAPQGRTSRLANLFGLAN